MKKLIPLLVLLLGVAYLGYTLIPPGVPNDKPNHEAFGKLPVLVGGRIKPIDTVARTTLLQFQGRQTVSVPFTDAEMDEAEGVGNWKPKDRKNHAYSPSRWIAEVLLDETKTHSYQVFEVLHPEVLTLLKLTPEDGQQGKRFSYNQLTPNFSELTRQAQLADPINAQQRTPFQREVLRVFTNVNLYSRIQASLVPPDLEDPLKTLTDFQQNLPAGIAAVRARSNGEAHDEKAATELMQLASRFDYMSKAAYFMAVPPPPGETDDTAWRNTGTALLQTFRDGQLEPHAYAFAGLARTWRAGQAADFNEIVRRLKAGLDDRFPDRVKKARVEATFKDAAPFYSGMNLFVAALLLAVFSWLKWPDVLGRSAFNLLALGFVLMTAGIGTRMWLEGRPPVTNLYSSALFVAWGAVLLCLVLEKIYPRGLASAVGGIIGFAGLIIAHHLSLSGDTLEMMRAVLDSNFWLATHVVIITIGYSATYLAGFLAALYVIRGVFTRSVDVETGLALERMVYGILCFATLFSLVGTILGGIWADQSWGRFWGWDPKENGALIIVLWNALILHVRWGKLATVRGFMALAVFGNIVTSWSWFGTNLLGVGLHSYGFTDRGFWALIFFAASQLLLIALAAIPGIPWRSQTGAQRVGTTPPPAPAAATLPGSPAKA